jgi:hypothetical protein
LLNTVGKCFVWPLGKHYGYAYWHLQFLLSLCVLLCGIDHNLSYSITHNGAIL